MLSYGPASLVRSVTSDLMSELLAVYPAQDTSSYTDFIRYNDIRHSIIVSDKGFPPSQIREELKNRPDLHFLTPIRHNDTRIGNHNMLSYDGVLERMGRHILYKKCAIKKDRFLYAFKDTEKAVAKEFTFLNRTERSGDFSDDEYRNSSV